MDYPGKAGRGRVWQTGVIVTANNRKLQAYGRGKRIRGISHGPYRPDFVLIDDLEDPTAIATPEQRDKTEKYVSDEVLPLGPPDGSMDVLWNNTIAHYDSAANRFHKKRRWVRRKFQAILKWPHRMDLWEQWEELYLAEAGMEGEDQGDEAVPYSDSPDATDATKSPAMAFYLQRRDDMDRGAVVSWPSVRPLIKLMMIRASGHRSFDAEYQNDPSNDKEAPFSGMKFWVHPDAQWLFHGVLDPSLGKMHRKGDPAAILVGGFRRDITKLSIVEAVVARMRPELQLEKLIAFHAEYRCLVWGVEDTAFQEYFRQQIVTQSAARGMPVPAIGIRNQGDKDLLIESVSPHVSNGLILFNQRHSVFNSQVRHWPEADHDDGPDALQMLWRLCLKRAGGVPRVRLGKATRA
jgi:predicted phage terminase large subunit-like protein